MTLGALFVSKVNGDTANTRPGEEERGQGLEKEGENEKRGHGGSYQVNKWPSRVAVLQERDWISFSAFCGPHNTEA